MNEWILEKAEILANRNYTIEFSKDKTNGDKTIYLAKNPALQGCMAQGDTLQDAIDNLLDARIDYIYHLIEDGGI